MKAFRFALLLILALILVACDGAAEDDTDSAAADQPAVESSPLESEPAGAPAEVPPTLAPAEPAGPPPEPQEISIEGVEGLIIQGTFYPGSGDGPRPGVLLLHMNGGNRGDWQTFAGQLADSGYSSLAIDMRGHGQTGSRSDWALAEEDLLQVWRAMAEREDVDQENSAIVGASIGANMALVTAAILMSMAVGCVTPREQPPNTFTPVTKNRALNQRAANKQVEVARRNIEAGDYSVVIPQLLDVISFYPESSAARDARYWLAHRSDDTAAGPVGGCDRRSLR